MVKTKINKITKKMSFAEILKKNPGAAEVLMNKGMHCLGCPMAMQETLEQGCLAHGINPDKILKKINKKQDKRKK